MAQYVFKRGNVWWCKFRHKGKEYKRTTKCRRKSDALIFAAEYRESVLGRDDARSWVGLKVNDEAWQRGMLRAAKRRSKERGQPFSLTPDDLVSLIYRSDGRCEVSGVPFSEVAVNGSARKPLVASLDRIDNSQGYTPENVRLVCAIVNFAMNEWGEEALNLVAKGIVLSRLQQDLLVFPNRGEQSDHRERQTNALRCALMRKGNTNKHGSN